MRLTNSGPCNETRHSQFPTLALLWGLKRHIPLNRAFRLGEKSENPLISVSPPSLLHISHLQCMPVVEGPGPAGGAEQGGLVVDVGGVQLEPGLGGEGGGALGALVGPLLLGQVGGRVGGQAGGRVERLGAVRAGEGARRGRGGSWERKNFGACISFRRSNRGKKVFSNPSLDL